MGQSLWQRAVLHVDMDAFYAAIEQRDRPELMGRPVVVGGSAEGRGVVSTASYEARPYGVHSAMPAATARRLCPHAVFLPPDFPRYAEVSREVMEILGGFTPLVEPVSLDEAYLEATGSQRLFGDPVEIARRIKEAIRSATRLTASIGVSSNKFLAKTASDRDKPDGLTVLLPEEVPRVLHPLPVRSIHGLGPETARALEAMGIHSIGDLARSDPALLEERLGSHGRSLHRLAHGLDDRPVEPFRERKSVSSENTFPVDVSDRETLERALREHCEDVAFTLRRSRLVARTVHLKLRYADFTTVTRSRTGEAGLDLGSDIYEVASALLGKLRRGTPVRLIGVGVSGLGSRERGVQLTWLENRPKRMRAAEATDRIADRFGKRSILPASLLPDRREPDRTVDLGEDESGR